MQSDTLQWYALQVRSKLANIASTTLRGKGYQEFLPVYRKQRRWSDRVKTVEIPLFPGYLFCRFDVQSRLLPILTTPGVIGILGAGRDPIAVSEHEIEAIQTVVRSGLPALPWPYVAVDSRILIEHGPLAGLEGIVVDVEKKYRLIVSVSLLQRSVAVEIERSWIRPLTPQKDPRVAPQGVNTV